MPSVIYEGPLYESIHPELNAPIASNPRADVMESCYQESLNNQAISNEVANKMENGTAIAMNGAPSQRSEEDNKEETIQTTMTTTRSWTPLVH